MEPRTAVQAGECLQPSPDLILHYDEKISILLSRGSNIHHGSGGKSIHVIMSSSMGVLCSKI